MIKHLALVCAATLVALSSSANGRLIDSVNPFVGTVGFGNCTPGAQIPYGAIQISPDTDDKDYDCAAGYKYTKPTIQGFSLTHLSGTGVPDLGDFLFLPGVGEMKPSGFSHEREWASPGYYAVDLLDSGVKAVYLNGKKVEGNRITKDGAHLVAGVAKRSVLFQAGRPSFSAPGSAACVFESQP